LYYDYGYTETRLLEGELPQVTAVLSCCLITGAGGGIGGAMAMALTVEEAKFPWLYDDRFYETWQEY
jgi:hypothetical protein